MTLQIERLRTIEQLEAFVAGSAPVDCKPLDRESAYDFVRRTLVAFDYHRLGKADRGCVRRYVVKVTPLSPAQLTRLVARHAETGAVVDLRARNSGRPFETRYGPIDIRLLAEVDEAFGQMSGLATCEILRRAFEAHGDPLFERLAGISRSHVYHLRGSRTYRARRTTWTKTKGSNVAHCGAQGAGAERRAGLSAGRHRASGRPGRREGRPHRQLGGRGDPVRVRRRRAGHLGAVPDPGPGSAAADVSIPGSGFHADNGSEYINHRMVGLLQKLRVGEFTKSRARRSNDNAPVEGKNARVVRRHLGHEHLPARFADDVDAFARGHLSPFVNFHRLSTAAFMFKGTASVNRPWKTPYLSSSTGGGAAQRRSLPNITSRLRGRPGELNRSLSQGKLVPESSDTGHQPPRLWPNPRFMLTFSLDNAAPRERPSVMAAGDGVPRLGLPCVRPR